MAFKSFGYVMRPEVAMSKSNIEASLSCLPRMSMMRAYVMHILYTDVNMLQT